MKIYADYAATTPLDPEVKSFMMPFYDEFFGNPSSVHQYGQKAHVALNTARKTVADFLHASLEEIIFTGSATESINTILKGIAFARSSQGKHIITSAVEHDATLQTCTFLETQGFSVSYLPLEKDGSFSLELLEKTIQKDTILISIMACNNEIGTIFPIKEIGKIAHSHSIFFHTDAVQYYPYFSCNVDELQVDALTLSGHKFYGPKGVGILYVRKGNEYMPLLHGGGQEFGKRSSTQNIPGIMGFNKAMELTEISRNENFTRVETFKNLLESKLQIEFPDMIIHGLKSIRSPHISSMRFPEVSGEALMIRLDIAGIAVSIGSACSVSHKTPSHVLSALGLSEKEARETIRVSLGKYTTQEEIEVLIHEITLHVKALRNEKLRM